MKYPIITFTKNDKKMASMNKFIADKRLLKVKNEWNTNIQVIDSDGRLYFIKHLEQDSGLLLWESIKSVGLMVKVKPVFEKDSLQIKLEDLKARINAHVEKNKRFWTPLDDGRGLHNMINEANNFETLIKMFR